MQVSASVGVIAYNEEANIAAMLDSVLSQTGPSFTLLEIICVSSACTDGTDRIIETYAKRDKRVRLIRQKEREGKASAVNIFIKEAKGVVCVLAGADTRFSKDALEELLRPFLDANVGMTGGRPVPLNDPSGFFGFTAHLLWGLHHELAMEHPKLGELTAFRKIISGIPKESAVDEASIESLMRERGLSLKYCEKALVYNRGPENLPDFLKQRRRIYAGHLWLKKSTGYSASTMSPLNILRALFRRLVFKPKELLFTAGAVFLECFGRFLGIWDFYVRKKNPSVWEVADSTKKLS